MPSVDIFIPLMFMLFFIIYRGLKSSRTITYVVGVRVLLVSLIIHLALRSWVWMMMPLYVAMIVLILLGLPHLKINPSSDVSKLRKGMWAFALSLAFISLILNGLFPIRAIPEPTGHLIVGTVSWDLKTDREELYGEPGSTRIIRAQAWYPAAMETEKSLWLGDGPFTSQGLAIDFGFPGFIFNHLRHVKSHANLEAPLLEGTYPLVIISHGWSGFRQLHTDLAEELASQGYIVIGIEHTYGSVGTIFEDGTQITVNREALPPRATTPNFLEYANALVNTYAGDIISVLDDIEAYANVDLRGSIFDHIDLSSVTVIGHSTGGGAAVKVGLVDGRVDAIIGLDAWVEPLLESELKQGLSIPSLLIRSEGWYISFNNSYLKTLLENSPLTPIAFQMNQTTHYDFGMVYMFSTLAPFIGLQGGRGMQMPLDQNQLVLDYLQALKDETATLFQWQNIPDVEALVFP
jgi:pimeloyl-ACP methyl ester carboxylesterase